MCILIAAIASAIVTILYALGYLVTQLAKAYAIKKPIISSLRTNNRLT